MRKFLIATHGSLAAGIQSSLDIIIGQGDSIFLVQAYLEENKAIEEELNAVMQQITGDDELVVFTDLLGGSITNQVLNYALNKHIHVVAGFNLPLVVEIVLAGHHEPIAEVIEQAIVNAKEQLVYVNKLIHQEKETE